MSEPQYVRCVLNLLFCDRGTGDAVARTGGLDRNEVSCEKGSRTDRRKEVEHSAPTGKARDEEGALTRGKKRPPVQSQGVAASARLPTWCQKEADRALRQELLRVEPGSEI